MDLAYTGKYLESIYSAKLCGILPEVDGDVVSSIFTDQETEA